jgi:hypothetical protein
MARRADDKQEVMPMSRQKSLLNNDANAKKADGGTEQAYSFNIRPKW